MIKCRSTAYWLCGHEQLELFEFHLEDVMDNASLIGRYMYK